MGLGLSLRVKCPARVPLAGQHSSVAVARNVLHLEAVFFPLSNRRSPDRGCPDGWELRDVPFRLLIELLLAAGAAEVEHIATKFRFVASLADIDPHSADRVFDFLAGHSSLNLSLLLCHAGAILLNDFRENADCDLLWRGRVNVEPRRGLEPSQPRGAQTPLFEVIKNLGGLDFACNERHIGSLRTQSIFQGFLVVLSLR